MRVDVKGKNNPMFGKKHSEATKQKMRQRCLGKYKGINNPNWKGGKIIRKNGYIWVLCPNHPHNIKGYVREHRLIMERCLGRYLEQWELVHHIDGNKQNNLISNLKIVLKADHNRIHYKEHLRDERGVWVVSRL